MEDKAPVALVTGAAKRIGATLARRLHANGYRVVVHYSSSYEEAYLLVNELNHSRPNSAISLQGNLCDSSHIDAIAERSVEAWGRLDVLVNNASSFYLKKCFALLLRGQVHSLE